MVEEPGALRDTLEAVTRRLGLSNALETGALWARWTEIVGPAIAVHAQPSSLRRGVLRVRADSPVWATEIGYLSAEIKDRINAALGPELVAELRVWTGPPPPARSSGQPRSRPERSTRRLVDNGSEPDPLRAFKRAKAAWSQLIQPSRERRSRQG